MYIVCVYIVYVYSVCIQCDMCVYSIVYSVASVCIDSVICV